MKFCIDVVVAAAVAALPLVARAAVPEAAFRSPEETKRPETYFFFFGGNVAAPGITADLEAVKSAGIAGIKLFNGNSARGAWPGVPKQIKCLSPEWDALVGHFGDECMRLDLRMAMQVCPGWAMAGGPWIKPEHAMRHLAVSRTDVEGGHAGRVTLPGRIHLTLAPAQSCFVVFRGAATSAALPCGALGDRALPSCEPVGADHRAARDSGALGERALPGVAPWRISFPEGWDVPTNTTVQTLAPWREMFRESPSARAFSGTATYTTEFDLEDVSGRVVLDLGRVESIARVELNGKTFHDLWAPPYRLDVTYAVREGRNALKIEVTDTWYNRLVYEGWLPEAKRRTWTFRRPSERRPLHDSGLIGPVEIALLCE